MASLSRMLANGLPLIFALLAFAFSLKAITSKDWATQLWFDNLMPEAYRTAETALNVSTVSPFTICSGGSNPSLVNVTLADGNITEVITYPVTCQSFKPSGVNASCVSLNVTGEKGRQFASVGDSRRCQQVAFTGNLAIASTTFIGLGFLSALVMTGFAFLAVTSGVTASSLSTTGTTSELQSAEDTTKSESLDEQVHSVSTTAKHDRHSRRHHHGKAAMHVQQAPYYLRLAPFVNLFLVTSFTIGGILYVLAQYYGIQAFIMSAPDNGKFAVGTFSDDDGSNDHHPWIQGKALTVFVSLSWFFAGLAGSAALLVWRLPTTGRTL